ncbi:MAG: ATP-binding protein [Candidatus Binataceae bacterium]
MKINLSVLDHLGLNLYSSMPAVLSETVANAWDADAEHADIAIAATEVTITDDGNGMDYDEVNEKFLTVGYQRRHDPKAGATTPRLKRHVMGRKGYPNRAA